MSDSTDDNAAPKVEAPEPSQAAPAVHSDQLWGGPRFIHNATGEPVWCETQADYFALLNREGLRMKDQQESTTGPEQVKTVEPLPAHLLPAPPVEPMTQDEAHIYGAITAVHQRHGLVETVWCDRCFARHVPHGCTMRVTSRGVYLRCRCGEAGYTAPSGTTDLVLRAMATASVTINDHTRATIMTNEGPIVLPAVQLHDMEALLIRRYIGALRARGKEPKLFHIGCWNGNLLEEDLVVSMSVDPDKISYVCKCRMLFHTRTRVTPGVTH